MDGFDNRGAESQRFGERDQGDGDVYRVNPDTWEPGALETKRWLIVQIPDPGYDLAGLDEAEYSPGPGEAPVIRRKRKFRVDYAAKLTPEEIAAAKDPDVEVPIITDRFTINDVVRK